CSEAPRPTPHAVALAVLQAASAGVGGVDHLERAPGVLLGVSGSLLAQALGSLQEDLGGSGPVHLQVVRLHQLVGQRLGRGRGLQKDRTGQVGALPNTRVNGLNVFIRERVRSSSVANKYTDELKGLLVHSRLQQMIVGLPPTWAGPRTLLPQPPLSFRRYIPFYPIRNARKRERCNLGSESQGALPPCWAGRGGE